jgi:AraC-like DNA-binding protein
MWLTDERRRRLSRARERLGDVSDAGRPLAEIAREAGLSPFQFIRRFDEVFGVTPHQFRIDRRIERAKRLLASGQRTVTGACFDVGFSSLGTFSALFTRRVGETPSSYRRRMRVMVQVAGPAPIFAPGCLSLLAQLPASAFCNFREAPDEAPTDH